MMIVCIQSGSGVGKVNGQRSIRRGETARPRGGRWARNLIREGDLVFPLSRKLRMRPGLHEHSRFTSPLTPPRFRPLTDH